MKQYFKRSPEVQEAVEIFEKATGIKVLNARRYTGSMKYLVNFTVGIPYEEMFKRHHGDSYGNHYEGSIKITYVESDYKHPENSNLEIAWTELGMDRLNAYMPKLRSL